MWPKVLTVFYPLTILALTSQFGKWTHASTLPSEEDILADPGAVQFTSEVDAALSPHINTLSALLDYHITGDDSPLGTQYIPALKYVKERDASTEAERNGLVYNYGDLTIEDRAMLFNWIHCKVPQASAQFHKWIGGVLPAHAATLLIASRIPVTSALMADEDYPEIARNSDTSHETFTLQCAWLCQRTLSLSKSRVDIDRECISRLEERMFEQSAAAGKAGMEQWGLDAGDHYRRWNPYANLPPHWTHSGRPISEDESIYEVLPIFFSRAGSLNNPCLICTSYFSLARTSSWKDQPPRFLPHLE